MFWLFLDDFIRFYLQRKHQALDDLKAADILSNLVGVPRAGEDEEDDDEEMEEGKKEVNALAVSPVSGLPSFVSFL